MSFTTKGGWFQLFSRVMSQDSTKLAVVEKPSSILNVQVERELDPVAAIPTTPTQVSSLTPSAKGFATFQFNAVPNAEFYRVVQHVGASYLTSAWISATACGVPGGSGVGSLLSDTAVAAGTHSWAIQAKSALGMSALSGYTNFVVTLPVPTVVSPYGISWGSLPVLNTMTPTMQFSAVAEATSYLIKVVDATLVVTMIIPVTAAETGVPAGTGTGSYVLPRMLSVDGSIWSIAAKWDAVASAYSPVSYFQLVSPSSTVLTPGSLAVTPITTSTTPTLQFNALAEATEYQVKIYHSATTTATVLPWITATAAGVPGGTGTGSYAISTPLSPGLNSWKVRAKWGTAIGSYNTVWQYILVQ